MTTLRTCAGRVARNSDRRVVLLTRVEPIGKLVVDINLVKLGRRLVELCRPGFAAIECHVSSTVVRLDLNKRVFRIYPSVMIVAMWRLTTLERRAPVCRLVVTLVVDINVVCITRVRCHIGVVKGTIHDSALVTDQLPILPEVVRAV